MFDTLFKTAQTAPSLYTSIPVFEDFTKRRGPDAVQDIRTRLTEMDAVTRTGVDEASRRLREQIGQIAVYAEDIARLQAAGVAIRTQNAVTMARLEQLPDEVRAVVYGPSVSLGNAPITAPAQPVQNGPSQVVTGAVFPGQSVTGQIIPGQTVASQMMPGQSYGGQSYSGQPVTGVPVTAVPVQPSVIPGSIIGTAQAPVMIAEIERAYAAIEAQRLMFFARPETIALDSARWSLIFDNLVFLLQREWRVGYAFDLVAACDFALVSTGFAAVPEVLSALQTRIVAGEEKLESIEFDVEKILFHLRTLYNDVVQDIVHSHTIDGSLKSIDDLQVIFVDQPVAGRSFAMRRGRRATDRVVAFQGESGTPFWDLRRRQAVHFALEKAKAALRMDLYRELDAAQEIVTRYGETIRPLAQAPRAVLAA